MILALYAFRTVLMLNLFNDLENVLSLKMFLKLRKSKTHCLLVFGTSEVEVLNRGSMNKLMKS